MTEDEIETLKIELEAERAHQAKLKATIDDLRRKVEVHQKEADVQKRHHQVYKEKLHDNHKRADQAMSEIAANIEALGGEAPDLKAVVKSLGETVILLKPAPTRNG